MHRVIPHIRLITSLLSVLLSISLAFAAEPTADVDQLNATETYQKWGQILFCQRIYKMPEVKSRLYDFDVEHCDHAANLAADVISKYSPQDQAQLKTLAERHASLLSRNTSEPYHSVGACREYCRKLSEFWEERDDQ